MIQYALVCAAGHGFDSWFASSAAYDKQVKRGLVACPVCGSTRIEKAIMAPSIRRGKGKASAEPTAPAPPAEGESVPAPVAMLSENERELRSKLKELREHLVKSADYVGAKFPEEARRMHYGEIEHRSIYGEASLDDAKALHEEGVEFHPLPRLPDDRN